MSYEPQMTAAGEQTRSESPAMWDHAGHNILDADTVPWEPKGRQSRLSASVEFPGEIAARRVPGNAWYYDCNVPIAAQWCAEAGLRITD